MKRSYANGDVSAARANSGDDELDRRGRRRYRDGWKDDTVGSTTAAFSATTPIGPSPLQPRKPTNRPQETTGIVPNIQNEVAIPVQARPAPPVPASPCESHAGAGEIYYFPSPQLFLLPLHWRVSGICRLDHIER